MNTEELINKEAEDFIKEYGYKTAGLEIFRRLLQTLTNEQINYGMKNFLGNSNRKIHCKRRKKTC